MNKILIVVFATGFLLSACQKSESTYRPLSSYTVVNATTDVTSARAYAADHEITWKKLPGSDNVAQYRSASYGAWAGENNIKAVSIADTNLVIYSGIKAGIFEEKKFNTLFLSGNIAAGYSGTLLINDNIVNRTDSVVGIRFINLSPNSTPVNISLSTTPTVNEVVGLAYKQKTDFKTYPALQSTVQMTFQLTDAGGTLLASYTLPIIGSGTYSTAGIANARFRNITLVVKGLQGTTSGTNAFGIFPVAHY